MKPCGVFATLKFAAIFLISGVSLAPLTTANAAVVVSEFMASNSATVADEDGDYSDWIELHNNGVTPVDISNWYLTDDSTVLTQWQLPAKVLAPGEFLIIFASSKDRSSSELHTNFKLGSGGEYLGLVLANGTTVVDEYSPEYPSQNPDVSFGIPMSGSRNYLATPTPGTPNSAAALARVVFDPAPGIFFSSVNIALGTDQALQAGELIHYSLDGTEPTTASPEYVGPFVRTVSTRIRARVLSATGQGITNSATYISVDPALATIDSALPIAVIDTFGLSISSNDVIRTPAAIALFDRTANGRAALPDKADFSGFAGLRVRGSSSAGFPKKQYKIELWEDFTHQSAVPPNAWSTCATQNQACTFSGTREVRYGIPGAYSYAVHANGVACNSTALEDPVPLQNKSCATRPVPPGSDSSPDFDSNLLGLGSESDWVLYAPGRFDRSYVANPLMYQLAGELGLEELKTQFIEVFLDQNGDGVDAGDYVGIYSLVESIKLGDKRVDIEKLSPTDTTLPEISGGYIIGRDRTAANKFSFTTPHSADDANGFSGGDIIVHRPKLKDLNANQVTWIENYVLDFEQALYGPDPSDPATGYSAFIDVPSWIDAHILRTLAMDPDTLRLSNYFYKNRGGKLVNAPVWDFDRTLNSSDSRDDNPQQIWAGVNGVDPFLFSWWGPLFAQTEFVKAYNTRWNVLRTGPLSQAALFARIDTLHAEISESYLRENARWGATAGYGSRYTDLNGEIVALKDWLSLRLAFLDSQFPSVPALSVGDATVNESDGSVSIAVTLNHPSENAVQVGIHTRAGSALGGGQDFFGATLNPLTFPPGSISQTFTIDLVNDTTVEQDEVFQIRLFNANGATIAKSLATIDILDDDTTNTPVTLTVAPQSVSESVGSAEISITLSMPSLATVTVGYATSATSASPGSDFYGKAGTLTFTPGETQKLVPVVILNDNVAETNEEFRLRLFGAVGADINTAFAPVTISDDDVPANAQLSTSDINVSEASATANVVINLSSAVDADVTVFTQALTTQGGGQDYTGFTRVVSFRNGQTTRSVTIDLINDNTSEATETMRLRLTNASGAAIATPFANITIIDDD